MTAMQLSEQEQGLLLSFLNSKAKPELLSAYLYFLHCRHRISPVVVVTEKTIFESEEEALKILGESERVWRETEIKVGSDRRAVNEETKKIYVCPFSGKVFGDNTHPNPQDAIYDWVSKCPENSERVGGIRVKRFYVSEDPGVIREYRAQHPAKRVISKVVFSSVPSGKLFSSKETVVKDYRKHYIKPFPLAEVQNQNRFEIEEHFLARLQSYLSEDRLTSFVEACAQYQDLMPFVEQWVDEEE